MLTPWSVAAVRAETSFPPMVTPVLAAEFHLLSDGRDLRHVVDALQQHTGLRVHVDRRVDPNQPLASSQFGPDVQSVIDQLSAEIHGWSAASDEVVLLGGSRSTVSAATEMMRQWDRIDASTSSSARALAASQPVAWPRLSTPQTALRQIADQWGLEIVGDPLPHDLWPAVDLGSVRVTTALGCVLCGFDLGFEIDAESRQVTLRPLDPAAVVQRRYPSGALSAAVQEEITGVEGGRPGARLRKTAHGWELTGDAQAHQRLSAALFAAGRDGAIARATKQRRPGRAPGRAPGTAGASGASEPLYSLRLERKPAGVALAALCQRGGLKLQFDPQLAEVLEQPIDLAARDQTLAQLIRQTAEAVDLSAKITDGVVTITAQPSVAE